MNDWLPSDKYDSWPGCRKCRHFHRLHCTAYPRNIPLPIASGEVDHMVPRPGDHGIQFEPLDAPAAVPSKASAKAG